MLLFGKAIFKRSEILDPTRDKRFASLPLFAEDEEEAAVVAEARRKERAKAAIAVMNTRDERILEPTRYLHID